MLLGMGQEYLDCIVRGLTLVLTVVGPEEVATQTYEV